MYQKSDPHTIQSMFATIASNYDRTNTTFSLGMHKRWNKKLIDLVTPSQKLLDLCAGTGEIAFNFLKQNPKSHVTLLDFCEEMLMMAEKKGANFSDKFKCIQGDAQNITLSNASFDAVTIAYGIRNVKEPQKCFEEVYRVLKAGGKFGILELTRPSSKILRALHRLYLYTCVPLLAKITTRNSSAYTYLVKSIEAFVSPEEIAKKLSRTGFKKIEKKPILGGIATIILAEK